MKTTTQKQNAGVRSQESGANTQHTPGPWIVTAINAADGSNIFAGKVRIGHTVSVPEKGSGLPIVSPDEAHANARLIAAAPELLETLRDFYTWLQAPAVDSPTLAHMQEKASSAIAKATGQ